MSVIANSYEKKDELFVETNAYRELKTVVEDQHWATLLGKAGDGKSTTATHLLLYYQRQGYQPLFVSSVRQWDLLISSKPGDKQFVVIDDMFGSINVDEKTTGEWLNEIEKMEKVVSERQGNLLVVSTSRKHIFMDVKSKLYKSVCFSGVSIVDMTDKEYKLSSNEKKDMLTKYANRFAIKLETTMIDQIKNIDSPHGFPHCVEMFCTNAILRESGVKFFVNPEEAVQKELHNFKDNAPMKFLVLLLVLYKKSHVHQRNFVETIDNPDEDVQKLFKFSGISLTTAYAGIMKAVNALTNTYLTLTTEGHYTFTHESLKENVAKVYINLNPFHATHILSFQEILTHVKTPTVSETLPYHELAERITVELLNGNVESVSTCASWRDPRFVDEWIRLITMSCKASCSWSCLSKTLLVKIFHFDKPSEYFRMPLIKDGHPMDFSDKKLLLNLVKFPKTIFSCLIKDRMNQAVIAILNNKCIQKSLGQHEEWFANLESLLAIACITTHDIDIIKAIIAAGEETSAKKKRLNGSSALSYAIKAADAECALHIVDNTEISFDDETVDLYFRSLEKSEIEFIHVIQLFNNHERSSEIKMKLLACVLQHYSAERCPQFLPMLRDESADFHHVNKSNLNALHIVCQRRNVSQYLELLKYLVDIGVDPSQESNEGVIPLMYALENEPGPDCIKFLVKCSPLNHRNLSGCNVVAFVLKTLTPTECLDILPILKERNADFHNVNENNMNALHIVCQRRPVSDYFDVMKYLVDIGVDPSQESDEGVNPLIVAFNRKRSRTRLH